MDVLFIRLDVAAVEAHAHAQYSTLEGEPIGEVSPNRPTRAGSSGRPLAEGWNALHRDARTQPWEPDRVPADPAPVDRPVGADFRHDRRPHQHRVQGITRSPRGREPYPGPRIPGAGGGEVLADPPGLIRAQSHRTPDRAQPPLPHHRPPSTCGTRRSRPACTCPTATSSSSTPTTTHLSRPWPTMSKPSAADRPPAPHCSRGEAHGVLPSRAQAVRAGGGITAGTVVVGQPFRDLAPDMRARDRRLRASANPLADHR